jgi:hypothetical protein
MQATDNRCDLCAHWHYRYPSDMGICKRDGGPGDGNGFSVPIAKAVLCTQDRAEFAHKPLTATTCDTRCDQWHSDGSPIAHEVAALRANAQYQPGRTG